ncbi:nuclear inhibitor of protein phosphatase 1 [Rhopalosiphum maidis]|uniref:nuclear inhibitor of protein phosphatase 1 n=1 Tax=Rhopalosiphum maidis TaxID=43146 RepID=UPI000EFDBBC8|nr:nuclear inhibitor of protein phosphatase 1 [Rhopalosiphum maidis]XP_060849380.1 nuclear inhibitor of protein phosphatase 1 [Rhopalosiphum padi]
MANHYDVPNWAGKPPVGLHLDVLKGDKLIQKLMLDQKKCYLFGRNAQMSDFCIDHQSCSRVHAAFVYHKHLNRAFLVDLGSTHGTYIGSIRIEADKPTQLPINSQFHFGASTRTYIIRERPQSTSAFGPRPIMDQLERESDHASSLLGLPETDLELDNLTEFNTAQNRRISMLGISDDALKTKRKRTRGVHFNEDEQIINPEDIDPSVGRFRNLIRTTVIPNKKFKDGMGFAIDQNSANGQNKNYMKNMIPGAHLHNSLYSDIPGPDGDNKQHGFLSSIGNRLGMNLPNPAPDVDINPSIEEIAVPNPVVSEKVEPASTEPKKKKYAKEAWPGKKNAPALLV